MNESKYPPVLTLRYDKNVGDYVGKFPYMPIESFRGDTTPAAMDAAAVAVGEYKVQHDHSVRIAELVTKIRANEMEYQRLQLEKQQLESAAENPLPIYSLLDEAERAIYVAGIRVLDPEYINWFESRYKCTVIQINLIESPGGNLYGTPLIWQWVITKNKDADDG